MSSIVIHSKNPYIETALTGMDVSNTKVTKYYTKDTTQETQTSTSCSLCPNLPVRHSLYFKRTNFVSPVKDYILNLQEYLTHEPEPLH